MPSWSLRFYKPEMLPRVSGWRRELALQMEAVPASTKPRPRSCHIRFRATRQKRRFPDLPALEVNADGTFDFPTARRVLVRQDEFVGDLQQDQSRSTSKEVISPDSSRAALSLDLESRVK
ncbi:unnamed protein product, partial [Durusdinium trenchii]